jgi:hypothetical protein
MPHDLSICGIKLSTLPQKRINERRQERNVRLRRMKKRKKSMKMKMDEFEKGNEYSRRMVAKNSCFFIFTFCCLI